MSDRRPTDDELLLEALEASRAGNGAAAAAESRLAHDRGLQAELEGLKAVQRLLADDAAWGQQSGADAPPPHLLDAILRAEVAARPAEIRGAVVAADAPPAAATSLWSRFSSWLVGGGVLVGAAAALLVTVSRVNDEPAAVPAMFQPAAQAVTPAAPAADAPTPPSPPPPLEPATLDEDSADKADKGAALAGGGLVRPEQEAGPVDAIAAAKNAAMKPAAATRKLPTARPDDVAERDAFADGSVGGSIGDVATGSGGLARAKDTAAGPAGRSLGFGEGAGDDRLVDSVEDEAPARSPALSPPPPAPAEAPAAEPAPVPMTTAAPAPAKPAPRIVSAREAQQEFLRARAKAEAIVDAKEKAKEQASSSKASSTESKTAKKSAGEARKDAELAREELARSQRLQEANGVLVTAERELQFARFAAALDLAQRAEALAGGGLGFAPASTQTRAYVGLKRLADAARVASRLLQASPADPQLVDGMIAGADAAVAIGDLRLAERLLQRAASTDNPDVARRNLAKQKLASLVGKAGSAPAKAKTDTSSTASSDQ